MVVPSSSAAMQQSQHIFWELAEATAGCQTELSITQLCLRSRSSSWLKIGPFLIISERRWGRGRANEGHTELWNQKCIPWSQQPKKFFVFEYSFPPRFAIAIINLSQIHWESISAAVLRAGGRGLLCLLWRKITGYQITLNFGSFTSPVSLLPLKNAAWPQR